MGSANNDLHRALNEVSASSAGGAPFLIAYGTTFVVTGLLSFVLPVQTAALLAMFQGGVALPFAFWLERRLATQRMAPDNPLRVLSAQLAMSQALAIPALIIVVDRDPTTVPAVLASLGGMHFVPYAWLHRTPLYLALAAAVSLGAFALLVILRSGEFPIIMLYVGLVYWTIAPFLYRHAAQIVRDAAAAGGPSADTDSQV